MNSSNESFKTIDLILEGLLPALDTALLMPLVFLLLIRLRFHANGDKPEKD